MEFRFLFPEKVRFLTGDEWSGYLPRIQKV